MLQFALLPAGFLAGENSFVPQGAAGPATQGTSSMNPPPLLPANLLGELPPTLPEELFQTILSRDGLRIERIVSQGHASPPGFWYDQGEHEFVVLLRGAARIGFEDSHVELQAGSYLEIPAHRLHRVEWTTPDEPTIWLAIFYSGRS